MCISSKLRLAERRQQRLQEVQAKRDHLCEELAETQGRLMVEPGRWLEQCECSSPSVAEQGDPPPSRRRIPDPEQGNSPADAGSQTLNRGTPQQAQDPRP